MECWLSCPIYTGGAYDYLHAMHMFFSRNKSYSLLGQKTMGIQPSNI